MNRKRFLNLIAALLMIFCIGTASGVEAKSKDLGISPRLQNTPVWCWVTVLQMVFEHYDIPNVNPGGDYQCGIIGALAGPNHVCFQDCRRCIVSAQSLEHIRAAIPFYPDAVEFLTRRPVRNLNAQSQFSRLSKSEVKTEIDAKRPIIVGISFDNMPRPLSQHVALIVGYDEDRNGNLTLTVNDPFPYDLPQFARNKNPYVAAGGKDNFDGSFTIDYDKFKSGLSWKETIYNIG